MVWVLFLVFSIFCITSFGDCTRPQHQEPLPVPHANTSPTPPKKKASKCDTPRFAPAVVIKDVLLFCSVICWWHPQIVSRVIMHVSNANLFKKMVCLSFNTVTIWPWLRHVRKSFRPSTQHNLSRLPSSETVLSRHSQRNGTSEELDAAVGHFFFSFSMVRRPQLCFTYPRRHECRTVQGTNWQGHSWRCQSKS